MDRLSNYFSDEHRDIFKDGAAAWKALKRHEDWNYWLRVGRAIATAQDMAAEAKGATSGRSYNEFMAQCYDSPTYLRDYAEIDKSDRSRAARCWREREAIEKWRQNIGLTKALRMNNPKTVLDNYDASRRPPAEKLAASPFQTTKQELAKALERLDAKDKVIADKDKEIERLKWEAARLPTKTKPETEAPAPDMAAGQPVLSQPEHRDPVETFNATFNEMTGEEQEALYWDFLERMEAKRPGSANYIDEYALRLFGLLTETTSDPEGIFQYWIEDQRLLDLENNIDHDDNGTMMDLVLAIFSGGDVLDRFLEAQKDKAAEQAHEAKAVKAAECKAAKREADLKERRAQPRK